MLSCFAGRSGAGRGCAGLVALGLLALPPAAQKSQARGTGPARPPRIECSLPAETTIIGGEELRFRVEARAPNGRRLSLTLLNPPPGLVFDPIVKGPSPSAIDVRWQYPFDPAGRSTLVFEARDDMGLVTRLERTIQILAGFNKSVLSADVTGDGVLDVIGGAYQADVNGVSNAGAIYVWAGAKAPAATPTARLTVPGAQAFDELGSVGYSSGQAIQIADVTGDGTSDVIALAEHARIGGVADGALYVFAGGSELAGPVAPRATLTAPGASGLGDIYEGQGVLVADLTGDGVLDLLAGAHGASPDGVSSAGAVYFYAGGAALSGVCAPSAIFAVPGAVAGDHLGRSDGQGLLVADVTGDGVLDLVAGAKDADVAGVVNAGAVYVWAGGSTMSAAPTATLTVPGAVAGDALGSQGLGLGLRLVDVTGDGFLDVVVGSNRADVGGIVNAGAIYVFAGGPALSGAVAPRARLTVPGATQEDGLGPDRAQGFRIGDVTGDGRLDVIGVSSSADVGGVANTGAVYVFSVGDASGTLAPRAVLTVPGAPANSYLANALNYGVYLVDLDSDGVLEVVTNSVGYSSGEAAAAGALHVFAVGDASGPVAPRAVLTVEGAVPSDWLGSSYGAPGLTFADVTRDGALDIVAMTHSADVGGFVDTGAIYVFSGAGGFEGALHQSARLTVPEGRARDDMYLLTVADVTGDGAPDILAGASTDIGAFDAGAIFVFTGRLEGEVHPTATLTRPDAGVADLMRMTHIADLTNDGVLDIVARTLADVDGLTEAGAIHIYRGGRQQGTVWPALTVTSPQPGRNDQLFPALIADFTGDGTLDLLGQSSSADVDGVSNAGALHLWSFPRSGGLGAARLTTLRVPGARPGDQLGF